MPAAFVITVVAGQDIPQDFYELEAKLQDLTPFMEDVTQIVSTEIKSNFATSAFPPLAQATLARKALAGSSMEPLVRSGALIEAATSDAWQISGGGGETIAQLKVPGYGGFHLDGTQYMPVRDWAFLDDSVDVPIMGAFLDFIYG